VNSLLHHYIFQNYILGMKSVTVFPNTFYMHQRLPHHTGNEFVFGKKWSASAST